MADMEVRVVVHREQMDALQSDFNKLNNTTITVKTREKTRENETGNRNEGYAKGTVSVMGLCL